MHLKRSKDLKRLLNDRMSVKEEKKMLEEMDKMATAKDYPTRAAYDQAEIMRLQQDKVDAQTTFMNRTQHMNNTQGLPYLNNERIRDLKINDADRRIYELTNHGANAVAKDGYYTDVQNRIPGLQQDIDDLEASVLDTNLRQKEIEDEEKIAMNDNINPASFKKTLNERIAESNTLFQGLINAGQSEPHITVPFERIGDFNDINELFAERSTGRITNMILIIYRSSELYGHWCALTRSNDLKRLTYFNSYGSYIDKAMDHIPQEFAGMTKQNFPYLLKLLHDSDYEIHWNDEQLQVMDNKTATCGHWCGLWMRSNKLGKTLEEFSLPFLSVPLNERDEIAARLAAPYLTAST